MATIQLLGGPRDGEVLTATPDADGSVSVSFVQPLHEGPDRLLWLRYVPFPEMDLRLPKRAKSPPQFRLSEVRRQELVVKDVE